MKDKKIYLCCEADEREHFTKKAKRMYKDYPMVDIVPEARLADTVFIIGTYTERMRGEIQHLREAFPKLDIQRVDTNFVNPDVYKLIRDGKAVPSRSVRNKIEMGR